MSARDSLCSFVNPSPKCAVCGAVITGHHDCVPPLSSTSVAPPSRVHLTPWGTWEWRITVSDNGSLVSLRIDWLLDGVRDELTEALDKFDRFNSPHEGKAVIEEELDELWEHVKANTGRSPGAMGEAIQVAAMALRYVHDLAEWGPK